jgi:hypothetical protein
MGDWQRELETRYHNINTENPSSNIAIHVVTNTVWATSLRRGVRDTILHWEITYLPFKDLFTFYLHI